MEEGRCIEGTNVFAAFEVTPQTGEGRYQRVVLHALALLPSQAPSVCQGMVVIDTGRLAALARAGRRRGIPLIDTRPSIAAQDGGDGGVRPTGMLSHGRGDRNAFCGHESHGVDGYGERIGHGGIEHLEREMRSVVSP